MIRFLQTPGPMKKIVLGGLLLIICAAMVITLVPGGVGSAFGFGAPPRGVVARVGGEDVTTLEVQREARQMLRQQMPKAGAQAAMLLPFFASRAADNLINRKVLLVEAERLGLRVNDEELRDELQHGRYAQVFFPEGKFIGQDEYEARLRQADIRIGETIAVIGAGLVGVLTIQIARAAGCRVVAIDLSPGRVARAVEFGADLAVAADNPALVSSIKDFSRYGVDAAILTAATRSAEPAEMAAGILRDRGRIVVVGDVGMGVSRSVMYAKELSLALSRSYGPGRYEPQYEEGGIDYPIGYVRWTEQRNMEAFLDLLASGQIDVTRLLEHRYNITDGAKAYAELKNGPYTAILEYSGASTVSKKNMPAVVAVRPCLADEVGVGCIGAGSFASSVIFPGLQSIKGVRLQSVGTTSGASAASAKHAFKFENAEPPSELLNNPDVGTVFILTRHDTHAPLVAQALLAGKPVFVEKPLAVDREQLAQVQEAYAAQILAGCAPFVMVGFNRRFAPFTEKIRQFFAKRCEPMLIHARVNAGYIPHGHWSHGEGGRIVGEFCHFVDWARSAIGSPIYSVAATGLPDGAQYKSDNIAVTLKFADGSVANLLYLANGDRSIPKEFFEVFCQGAIARLHDFRTLELARNGEIQKFKSVQDKGHRRELQLTIEAIRSGKPSPIPFEALVEVTETTFLVQRALATGEVIRLAQTDLTPARSVPHPEMPNPVQRNSAATEDVACA